MIIVTDTETSGLDPAAGHAIVEIAMVPMTQKFIGIGAASLVAPGRRVDPGARAAHHITDEELRVAPHLPEALHKVWRGVCYPKTEAPLIIAAHNAEFDRGFAGGPINHLMFEIGWSPAEWLCTWKCARHLYPDAPGHSNQVLRYHIPGADAQARALLPASLAPHRALYDAIVTAVLLKEMLKAHPLSYLLELQYKPVLLKTCNLPKHRGALWSQVPLSYLQWIIRADPPFDADTLHTARHYAGTR